MQTHWDTTIWLNVISHPPYRYLHIAIPKGLSLLQMPIAMNVADLMQQCILVYCYVTSDILQVLKAFLLQKCWLRYMSWTRWSNCNTTQYYITSWRAIDHWWCYGPNLYRTTITYDCRLWLNCKPDAGIDASVINLKSAFNISAGCFSYIPVYLNICIAWGLMTKMHKKHSW